MRHLSLAFWLVCLFLFSFSGSSKAEESILKLKQSEILHYASLVNDYFMRTYPDVGAKSYVDGKERDSKIWTRGVYYEGLMAMYYQYPNKSWLKYAEDWGNHHKWITSADNAPRHADFQCCGQAYLDLYMLNPEETVRKEHIKKRIDDMLATNVINDWYWIDAIQMAMPIFAQLGTIENDDRYFERMYEMYMHSRDFHGGSKKSGGLPLFNEEDGLWYRDYQYDPPYMDLTETDKPCYWSRGNGWVYVALARVLHYSPEDVVHKQQYIDDFLLMSEAIRNCQREDGFWSVSMAAPSNTGHEDSPGPETSGTALFVAGMAYGIRTGLLDEETYLPLVIKGWNAMCQEAVHEDGFLGFVQGTGAKPEDGQPVMYDSTPNFEDYGIGCFLLAAAEVFQLGEKDIIVPLKQSNVLHYASLVNDYFMRTYPDVGANSYVDGKKRDSKIWTRGIYYEGLMALYHQYPDETWLKYAEDWGTYHKWMTSANNAPRHADYQCCGQAYLDMYMLRPKETVRKEHIKMRIDDMLATNVINDWYWIDAIQMAMPIFAQLGTIENDDRYFERMYEMYMHTRNSHGGNGKSGGLPLFNEEDGLWYRDYQYDPPYMDLTETDKPCYWSRGNGWVYVALARVLHYSPEDVVHKDQYIHDFLVMSEAIKNCQREDGFWSVSLAAPSNTGHEDSPGPETSGTALFVAGMAYGIHTGLLDEETYLPLVIKGWNAMCQEAVHENGFLGYVQGTGAKPEDGQPVMYDSTPNFEDFGIGCFLLAAAEVFQLGIKDVTIPPGIDSVCDNVICDNPCSFTCFSGNDGLHLEVYLSSDSPVGIDLLDTSGRLVKKVDYGHLNQGNHSFVVTSSSMKGYYICRMKTAQGIVVQKVWIN